MSVINSADYVGIATYISWINVAGCIRFEVGGVYTAWTCSKALSFINSFDVVMPPYACTHNP